MLIGYARVSTHEQDPMLQVASLHAAGCERIYVDKKSGKNMRRPEWKQCRLDLREGDTLIVWKLDRLARSVVDLSKTARELDDAGISLVIITQNIDTRTPSGRFLFNILAAVAEMERDLISERTKAGMAQRRADGSLQGGLHAITPRMWESATRIIAEHRDAGTRVSDYRLVKLVRADIGSSVSFATYAKWRDILEEGGDYPERWKERLRQYKQRKRGAEK